MLYWLVTFLSTAITDTIIIIGVIGFLITTLSLPFIRQYEVQIKLVSIVLFSIGVWSCGIHTERQKHALELEKQKAYIAELEKKASEKTIEVVTKYVDRVKVVKENSEKIYEQVPIYISKEDDARCIIPNDFVSLHDAAVQNKFPESPRDSNEGPSGIELSEATQVIIKNYGQYHEVVEQLLALQKWVKAMEANFNNKN